MLKGSEKTIPSLIAAAEWKVVKSGRGDGRDGCVCINRPGATGNTNFEETWERAGRKYTGVPGAH